MLTVSLPDTLTTLLAGFAPCFTVPTFGTFQSLVAGFLAQPGLHTVTWMLSGAGLAGRRHHDLAYRFFATARWSADQLAWSWWTSSPRRWSPPTHQSCWQSTTPCGAGLTARSTAPPGITTATAPAATGPPGATAGCCADPRPTLGRKGHSRPDRPTTTDAAGCDAISQASDQHTLAAGAWPCDPLSSPPGQAVPGGGRRRA
jgi:hypothetical protein